MKLLNLHILEIARLQLHWLELLCFGSKATRWFKSYLTDRPQYVCNGVEKPERRTRKIICGVPQGSLSWDLRYSVYTRYNSIADSFVHSETTLYADDSEAHCSHYSVHESAMNNDLQNVEQWLKANRMIANIKKTKTMLIGSRPALRKAEAENIQIHLFNNKIEEVTTFD